MMQKVKSIEIEAPDDSASNPTGSALSLLPYALPQPTARHPTRRRHPLLDRTPGAGCFIGIPLGIIFFFVAYMLGSWFLPAFGTAALILGFIVPPLIAWARKVPDRAKNGGMRNWIRLNTAAMIAYAMLLTIIVWAVISAPTAYDPANYMRQRNVCAMLDCGIFLDPAVD